MFDWIGDAIDWIGDGISSLWDNTIGGVTDAIGDWIWEAMFEWLFNLIYGAIADLFEFINETTSDIFAMSWVQAFVGLFQSLAWMLFVCGLVVAVFDTAIAYESGQANIKSTCLNVLKGFMAASLVTVVPQRLYSFCVATQGTFTHELLGNFIGDVSDSVADSGLKVIVALSSDVSLFSLFFIILFGYCMFISDLTMIPVSYIRTKFPRYKKARICQYTREGREEIHKTLKFDEDVIKTMHLLAKAKTYGRSIEYMDNRISLYAAQYGKCAVTGEILWIDEIHCHHKKPISQSGTDEYKNLVIVRDDVHKLIHATRQETIIAYLNVLNLNKSQLQKLNKLRIMAGNPAI